MATSLKHLFPPVCPNTSVKVPVGGYTVTPFVPYSLSLSFVHTRFNVFATGVHAHIHTHIHANKSLLLGAPAKVHSAAIFRYPFLLPLFFFLSFLFLFLHGHFALVLLLTARVAPISPRKTPRRNLRGWGALRKRFHIHVGVRTVWATVFFISRVISCVDTNCPKALVDLTQKNEKRNYLPSNKT